VVVAADSERRDLPDGTQNRRNKQKPQNLKVWAATPLVLRLAAKPPKNLLRILFGFALLR
jgi:hypothetical protein